jgi:hypothetical protein
VRVLLALLLVGCGPSTCMMVCDCYPDGEAIPRNDCATPLDCQRECSWEPA